MSPTEILYQMTPEAVKVFFSYATHVGDLGLIWIVLATFFFRKKFYREGVLVLVGLLASYVSTELFLKDWIARPRPFVELEGVRALVPASGFSFPSGHATSSFVSAATVSYGLGKPCDRPFLVASVYGLASLIALSRVLVGVHYISDVLAGALWGSLLAWGLVYASKLFPEP